MIAANTIAPHLHNQHTWIVYIWIVTALAKSSHSVSSVSMEGIWWWSVKSDKDCVGRWTRKDRWAEQTLQLHPFIPWGVLVLLLRNLTQQRWGPACCWCYVLLWNSLACKLFHHPGMRMCFTLQVTSFLISHSSAAGVQMCSTWILPLPAAHSRPPPPRFHFITLSYCDDVKWRDTIRSWS